MIEKLNSLNAKNVWNYFAELCEEPENTQAEILQAILKNAKGCRYFNEHNLSVNDTPSEFRKKVPLNSWSNFLDASKKMQNGETDILFKGKPVAFLATSGTSGLEKLIPETEIGLQSKMVTEKIRRHFVFSAFPEIMKGKLLPLVNKAPANKTPAGIPFGSASGLSTAKSAKALLNIVSFPFAAFDIADQDTQDYVIMLFSIAEDIRLIVGNNIARMAKLTEIAKANARQICTDIENGTIDNTLPIETETRKKLEQLLNPNTERATELRAILDDGNDFIPANYWKNLKVIYTWLSGSIGNWVDSVKHLFGNGVTYFDYGYGASEGKFNIPHKPGISAGILALHGAFYEFIPYNKTGKTERANNPETLLAHQLKKGELYEMVVTTFSGLYRYNMHDIIKVEGFYKNTPEIVFVSKTGDVGDLVGERLAGSIVNRVVPAVLAKKPIAVKHVCAVTKSKPPHYIFCIEPDENSFEISAKIDKINLAILLDNEFQKEVGYKLMRRDNLLLAPEIKFMKPGWQQALYDEKTPDGLSTAQVKLPVIYNEQIPKAEFLAEI